MRTSFVCRSGFFSPTASTSASPSQQSARRTHRMDISQMLSKSIITTIVPSRLAGPNYRLDGNFREKFKQLMCANVIMWLGKFMRRAQPLTKYYRDGSGQNYHRHHQNFSPATLKVTLVRSTTSSVYFIQHVPTRLCVKAAIKLAAMPNSMNRLTRVPPAHFQSLDNGLIHILIILAAIHLCVYDTCIIHFSRAGWPQFKLNIIFTLITQVSHT